MKTTTNKTIRLHFILFFFTFFICRFAAAQEVLTPLYHNSVISSYLAKYANAPNAMKGAAVSADTLELPIYDDFSGGGIYPDTAIWLDSNVFINSDFSTNAPTVGMATFDGLDKYGNAYDISQPSAYGETDKLESRPINLFMDDNGNPYTAADSITLSFYYQRRGLGDSPEIGDSLQLEFWEPDSAQWYWQWSMDGGTFDFNFIKISIKISDPLYFKNGFKFRFRSYGSLTGSLDNWHLDYVILKKQVFPSDAIINDIGYHLPAHSLIRNYTSIPYNHYKDLGSTGQHNLMKWPDTLSVFNLFNTASAPAQANLRIFDESGNLQYIYNSTGAGNIVIPANSITNYGYPFPVPTYAFPDTIPGDYASFELIDNLGSPNQDYNKMNDTVRWKQVFDNYYAYDDGTAEAGYSLANSPNGKLAYSFDIYSADTMRGMFIHWNQMYKYVGLKLFKIVVWSSLSPEVILYQELNQKPLYDDSINGFRYYPFSSGLVLPAGTYYIGIVQSAADDLYLGFDRNINSNSKMYFNTNGTWLSSTIPGSYMLRPVFGDSVLTTGIAAKPEVSHDFSVFPNPAGDYIRVKVNRQTDDIWYEISDLSGRIVKPAKPFESLIDISILGNGFYFIRFYQDHGSYSVSEKLVVSKP
jgi:hypothetical protein